MGLVIITEIRRLAAHYDGSVLGLPGWEPERTSGYPGGKAWQKLCIGEKRILTSQNEATEKLGKTQ